MTSVDCKSREEEVRLEGNTIPGLGLLLGQKKRQGAAGERILNAKQGGQ